MTKLWTINDSVATSPAISLALLRVTSKADKLPLEMKSIALDGNTR